MQRPLQITFRGFEHSDALAGRIREKAQELEQFSDRIIGCHVTVEAPHQHHHKGQIYEVRLDITLPDKEILVGRERRFHHAHEDVYVALRDAFDAAARQIEDYARRERADIKEHAVPSHGRVVRLFPNEGYGFVETTDGLDVYFHRNSLVGAIFAELAVGDEVRVSIAEGEGTKGPQASTVIPIGKHHLAGEV
ncbi:MAG TPA: HPF/RaiA family ribosome-associated protein [Polyangiaceae bacterium]|nr:HPF/RaiA family ribosome-associated protein [Polyangiaceae bacterium]